MRTRAVVGAAAALAVVALAVASFAVARRDGKPAITKAELTAWENAILPALQDGGRTVEQGMKPAVDDLVNRHVVPAYVIAKEADGWAEALAGVKARVAAVATPPVLRPAVDGFTRALDEYVLAAKDFHAAALAPAGPQRDALVASGRAHGEAADHTYDTGAAVVQRLRHELGMPASSFFPEGSE